MDERERLKFFYITLPQISPILFFNVIMQTITALQNFTSAFVVTNGGPNNGTYVLGMKLYNEAFKYFKMGYASAVSWVIFAMILVVTLLLFRFSSKEHIMKMAAIFKESRKNEEERLLKVIIYI